MGELRIFGYIIIIMLVLSIILMPMVEMFNVFRERIILGTAITNSCRAAAEIGYDYLEIRRLSSEEEESNFRKAFAATFAASFGIDHYDDSSNYLEFYGNGVYNSFTVTLDFNPVQTIDSENNIFRSATRVTVEAKFPYKFKTGAMRRVAETPGLDIDFDLISKRSYVMQVVN